MRKNIVFKLMLPTFLLFSIYFSAHSQNRIYTYYLNDRMESVAQQHATVIAKGRKMDTLYLMQYYQLPDNGLLGMEQYKDSTLSVLHGERVLYYANSNVKERAYYRNNRLSGLMMKWDSTGNLTDSGHYKDDHLLFGVKKQYVSHRWLCNTVETDSLHNTLRDTDYDSTGNKLRAIAFVGSSGLWTEYRKDGTVESVDSVFTREDREAKFPPENGGWRAFLQRNLDGTVPIRNGAEGSQGTVIIQFVIEKDGTVSNLKPLTKIGFGAEEEVLRILKKSPKWIPANRYGKAVKAYRKQPVTFNIRG